MHRFSCLPKTAHFSHGPEGQQVIEVKVHRHLIIWGLLMHIVDQSILNVQFTNQHKDAIIRPRVFADLEIQDDATRPE
jgi:hypothetical protein